MTWQGVVLIWKVYGKWCKEVNLFIEVVSEDEKKKISRIWQGLCLS